MKFHGKPLCENFKKKASLENKEAHAGNQNRTGTSIARHRILSPGRLPIPPSRRLI